VVQT
jgi:hypothetical protein